MRPKLAILPAAISLLAAAVPAIAHHAFAAEYDANQPVRLKGFRNTYSRTRTRSVDGSGL
jgi:hypothetical protein